MWSSLPGVKAQSYSPYLGPQDLKKGSEFKLTGVQVKVMLKPSATTLDLGCQWLVSWVASTLVLSPKPLFGKVSVSYGSSPLEKSLPSIGRDKKLFRI